MISVVDRARPAYLVELWPYAHRSRGIGAMQIFGKAGGFFSTYVNPHGIDNLGWGYFAVYCGWIFFELGFIYWFYPETYKRTLEELAFRAHLPLSLPPSGKMANNCHYSLRGRRVQR